MSHPRASNKAGDLETLGRLRADVVSKYELPPTVKITDEAQASNYLEVYTEVQRQEVKAIKHAQCYCQPRAWSTTTKSIFESAFFGVLVVTNFFRGFSLRFEMFLPAASWHGQGMG